MEDVLGSLVRRALRLGAAYADARYVRKYSEAVATKNGAVDALSSVEKAGVGVRVIVGGAWGFASTSSLEGRALAETADEACRLARASASALGSRVQLAPVEPVVAHYATPVEKDPFQVPMERRIALLLECDEIMASAADVNVRRGEIELVREEKVFVSSEGARIRQTIVHTIGGITATATNGEEVQTRSYPCSFGHSGASRGWEFIEELNMPQNAAKIAREAHALLTAEPCPAGEMTVILGSSQLALQIHESCGHAAELDRVFGMEASYAGTSFLTTDKLGKFRYGSKLVNIVADATTPGGLGTFGYDDEGVPAQRTPLVHEGLFVGYMSSRETAPKLGLASSGAMRAEGHDRLPLIRMTNVNLAPGDCTLEEMIADTKYGIFMDVNSSWSIDDKRLNFQFGCEIGWLIERGSLTRMVRNPSYTGMTPEFWRSCDAIANEREWVLWGITNCGKGEPNQNMNVGHGAAPARFRNVQVGVVRQ